MAGVSSICPRQAHVPSTVMPHRLTPIVGRVAEPPRDHVDEFGLSDRE
jgi:hypothetical protein